MLKITVCIGSSCHLKGSRLVVEELQYLIEQNGIKAKIDLGGEFCMNRCNEKGVNVTVDGEHYSILPEEVKDFFQKVILPKVSK